MNVQTIIELPIYDCEVLPHVQPPTPDQLEIFCELRLHKVFHLRPILHHDHRVFGKRWHRVFAIEHLIRSHNLQDFIVHLWLLDLQSCHPLVSNDPIHSSQLGCSILHCAVVRRHGYPVVAKQIAFDV